MEEYRIDDSGKTVNVLGLVFGLIFTVIFIAAIVAGCYMYGKWRDSNNFSSSKSTSTFLTNGAGMSTELPSRFGNMNQNTNNFGQLTNRFNTNSGRFGNINNAASLNQPSIYVNQNVNNGLKASINSASSGYNTRPVSNLGTGNPPPQPLPSIGQPNRSQAWMDWNKNVANANI